MRFRIIRASHHSDATERPVMFPLMDSVSYMEDGEEVDVDWFIELDSVRDLVELDRAAGGNGLIVYTTDHDWKDTDRPCPEIIIRAPWLLKEQT